MTSQVDGKKPSFLPVGAYVSVCSLLESSLHDGSSSGHMEMTQTSLSVDSLTDF